MKIGTSEFFDHVQNLFKSCARDGSEIFPGFVAGIFLTVHVGDLEDQRRGGKHFPNVSVDDVQRRHLRKTSATLCSCTICTQGTVVLVGASGCQAPFQGCIAPVTVSRVNKIPSLLVLKT
ncbi:uncharacterized protein LOC113464670 [Ceratina calcarata]|uniref:Uncharacterized protein LOC113464670 n=1 Tax=Ceratina calcarata TaxID=156304 RepID=A0AAJ7WCL1_9HYME|nr:uncharacterized protein LOC113464670 [Ceratina calcarata]